MKEVLKENASQNLKNVQHIQRIKRQLEAKTREGGSLFARRHEADFDDARINQMLKTNPRDVLFTNLNAENLDDSEVQHRIKKTQLKRKMQDETVDVPFQQALLKSKMSTSTA